MENVLSGFSKNFEQWITEKGFKNDLEKMTLFEIFLLQKEEKDQLDEVDNEQVKTTETWLKNTRTGKLSIIFIFLVSIVLLRKTITTSQEVILLLISAGVFFSLHYFSGILERRDFYKSYRFLKKNNPKFLEETEKKTIEKIILLDAKRFEQQQKKRKNNNDASSFTFSEKYELENDSIVEHLLIYLGYLLPFEANIGNDDEKKEQVRNLLQETKRLLQYRVNKLEESDIPLATFKTKQEIDWFFEELFKNNTDTENVIIKKELQHKIYEHYTGYYVEQTKENLEQIKLFSKKDKKAENFLKEGLVKELA